MERKNITVGFISATDPNDRKPQSGTTYKAYHSLSDKGYTIKWIPAKPGTLNKILLSGMKGIQKILRIPMPHDRLCLSYNLLTKGLDKKTISQCDVLFSSFSLVNGKLLNKPLIYMSDAIYSQMVGYYWKEHISSFVLSQGNKTQQITLDSASHLVFSSQWAADAAIKSYSQPKSKISVIEFGANIDDKDIIPHKFSFKGHLHVLFIGVDWNRKGGVIAVEAVRWLNQNNIPATLHIIGPDRIDEATKSLPFIDYVGFLNKNIPGQYDKFVGLLRQSHCMLLPTLAECAGIAFSESSANGIPVFSHITGGVPNYIVDGINGYLLPLGSSGKDFGKKIKETLLNGEMEKMSQTATELYRTRLNWSTWGDKVAAIIDSLAAKS